MWVVFDCPLNDDPSTSDIAFYGPNPYGLVKAAQDLSQRIASSLHYESDAGMMDETPPLDADRQQVIDHFVSMRQADLGFGTFLRFDTTEWAHILMEIGPAGINGWSVQ